MVRGSWWWVWTEGGKEGRKEGRKERIFKVGDFATLEKESLFVCCYTVRYTPILPTYLFAIKFSYRRNVFRF